MEHEPGIYRITEDINKFVLRITLKKMRVTKHREGTPAHCPEEEVLEAKWNEKYFSQEEEERYANEANCASPAEFTYHQKMLEIRENGGRLNNRLFTYTSSDIRSALHNVNCAAETKLCVLNGSEIVTEATLHRRTEGPVQRRHTHLNVYGAVIDRPSMSERNSNRFLSTTGHHSMLLMADLRQMDGRDEADEHVLCQLTISNDGILTIIPDVTRDNSWYRVENRHREVFEYSIENASLDIDPQEKRRHQQLVTKIGGMASTPDLGFDRERGCSIYGFGSIVSASGYDSGNLYVRTELNPGGKWHLGDCVAIATTQICNQVNGTAHFSLPFEYKLVYSNPQRDEIKDGFPSVVVKVCSLDTWDRHRVEGYGMRDLPLQPGFHRIFVHTWRLKPRHLVEQLRHFFIGGGPQLQEDFFPLSSSGSRFGLQTETTGCVELCLNIVLQKENDV